MTYEELLAAALATDSFEAKKALARWLDDHHDGWNGEDYDISDIGAPSGSRTMIPIYGEEDEDGSYPVVDYKIF